MTVLAAIDILFGIAFNELIVPNVFRADHQLTLSQRFVADVIIVFIGGVIYLNRDRTRFVNGLITLHALVFSLLVGEVVLRLLVVRTHVTSTGRPAIVYSKSWHHDYSESRDFKTYLAPEDGSWGPVENRINSKGMRGPEIPPKKKGELRILLLGDSFIQADEIPYSETVGERLNHRLYGSRVRVLQKGMSSWSPILELNWLVKLGLSLRPDVVVLFLCINDFYGLSWGWSDASYTKRARLSDNGIPIEFELTGREGKRKPWNDLLIIDGIRTLWKPSRAQLPKPLSQRTLRQLLEINPSGFDVEFDDLIPGKFKTRHLLKDIIRLARPVDLWNEKTTRTVDMSLEHLDVMNEVLKRRQARFLVTLVPFGWNVSLGDNFEGRKHYGLSNVILPMGGIEETIKAFAKERGIEYIDLHRVFLEEEAKRGGVLYLNVDGHWNPRGHRVVAAALYDRFGELPQ